ncbi:hypothetical protein PAPYR_8128 [Paratrimastix pyriformis]|uniref:Uncharacterized protein n=1 Tax=Paratrimastix pyriformis TaxID=342808 RepID=A0ABQ8UB91_9EUKA|nr:hypothetical protein PAPYR_8128 [Paratrimastix pyriformis]
MVRGTILLSEVGEADAEQNYYVFERLSALYFQQSNAMPDLSGDLPLLSEDASKDVEKQLATLFGTDRAILESIGLNFDEKADYASSSMSFSPALLGVSAKPCNFNCLQCKKQRRGRMGEFRCPRTTKKMRKHTPSPE